MVEAAGILFIGDPHLCSTRVGRRTDAPAVSTLNNLIQAGELCTQKNLLPVVLGDLFHHSDDSKLWMLNRFSRIAQTFPTVPIVLGGNHDMAQTSLSEDDALDLLGVTKVIQVISESGLVGIYAIAGKRVALSACLHEDEIPDEIPRPDGVDVHILITHHDLAFGGSYPGAGPLKEIKGVDMVVNGHMHKTAPSVTVGQTTLHNPGNINRLSVDVLNHEEAVWSWAPGQGTKITQHVLAYEQDVFDLTGLQITEVAGKAMVASIVVKDLTHSRFAELMAAEVAGEASRSDDGSMLLEDLNTVMTEQNVSTGARALLERLAKESKQAEKST